MSLIDWCERGLVPDPLTRIGIRRLCMQRLSVERAGGVETQHARLRQRLRGLAQSPLAIKTHEANQQHYEVPTAFYLQVLGPRLKYSSALYPTGSETLGEAETKMLELYVERAELQDGQDVLELGCGWGSLTLYLAERFPTSRIVALSNSRTQRQHIEATAQARRLLNIHVHTQDINQFAIDHRFDRVVSIEMFEHLRNYRLLFERIHGWLKPGGKLFTHIFCHESVLYPFEEEGESNWMGQHFFSGGLMPSFDTFLHFQEHLKLDDRWRVSGSHYQKTAEHWLDNLDRNRRSVTELFASSMPRSDAQRLVQRWRMFFMSCAELFGMRGGAEWGVGHYRFVRPG